MFVSEYGRQHETLMRYDKEGKLDDGQPTIAATLGFIRDKYKEKGKGILEKDLCGNLEIDHPLKVAYYSNVITKDENEDEKAFIERLKKIKTEHIVKLLHDFVEDGFVTEDDLRKMGYHEGTIKSILTLTDKKYPKDIDKEQHAEEFLGFVKGIIASGDVIAIRSKLNDVTHNLTDGRIVNLPKLSDKEWRARKYEESLKILKAELNKTGSEKEWSYVYKKALEEAENNIEKYRKKDTQDKSQRNSSRSM